MDDIPEEEVELTHEELEELLEENSPKIKSEQDYWKWLNKAYSVSQNNVKKSEELRIWILKGLKRGETQETLLLKALECISCMTGDSVFFEQAKNYISS
jgi:hypothetical protein